MGINSPYHSSMEKEITKACKILDAFFNPKMDADKAVPFELLQNAAGIAFLTVIKAGMIWTGKVGTGIVLSRLEDGSWSPPSGIGTAGVGFGAEIGGEIIDFMIILGSQSAVQSFKRGTQLSVGAGLELAVGPVGRAGGANVNAGGSGLSSNYTYSHAKGLFAGVGLHGSTILVRGELNTTFYGREVSPMQILSGGVTPPPGSCDRLFETLQRAGADMSGGRSSEVPFHVGDYGSHPLTGYGDTHRTSRSFSGRRDSAPSASSAGHASAAPSRQASFGTSSSNGPDPRLRRFTGYKTEQEIYAQYAKPAAAVAAPPAPSTTSTSSSSSISTSLSSSAAPTYQRTTSQVRSAPAIPGPAEGGETKQVFTEVINFMTSRVPYADIQTFKDNCRRFGQDQMSLDAYFFYLNSVCTTSLLRELIPKLVRLLPTHEKRVGLWVRPLHAGWMEDVMAYFLISLYELAKVLEAMGQKPSEEELFQMISEVDDDHSGEIEFPEFLRVIETQKRRAMEYDDESDFIDAYVACGGGPDKTGHVERRVLVHLIKKDFGLPIDIDKMLDELDTDGSGEIEYDEFKALLSQ
ncbi:hypothetical protein DYB37_002251 [Aphanomyces astaci]|uniref:EF-hand domain-containing protein n=1 Tax=Aphanomyces astaci TaxID=112090 RepID=A0A397DSR9_APHAT|nr:hypothetical protein DYB36_000121 [Aphanomyces astaci]RHY19182.1 hypothetical protein DYB25_002465 [Aphanomyces astaci]RHY50653.1 hypothetical protein DYB34_002598 [Aphanomyces astaci]RHY67360.1 hypothetical protein DYB30_000799 [Aphanomyces astaci]RHY96681.1 hypothetical protein DYB35_001725 [Aphanomyces astaci]